MTRSQNRFRFRTALIIAAAVLFFLAGKAEAQKQSETAESLGLGGASRFDTGYSPITIDRTKIVPGVPFNVKPTMDNLVNTSKTSMGGILNRFDTSKFGQMFSAGDLATASAAISRTGKKGEEHQTVSSAPAPKIYPPQLEMDYRESPPSDATNPEIKKKINRHLGEVLDRYPLTGADEQVILVFEGRKLILRGQIDSSYTAEILVLTMQMEPGIDEVVNELQIPRTEKSAGVPSGTLIE